MMVILGSFLRRLVTYRMQELDLDNFVDLDEEISDFLKRFQSLRVLSLLHVGKLPNSIGSLKQLWYINLS